MTLNNKSFLIRYAYGIQGEGYIPKQTSVCALFWRCIAMAPAWVMLGGLAAVMLLFIYLHDKFSPKWNDYWDGVRERRYARRQAEIVAKWARLDEQARLRGLGLTPPHEPGFLDLAVEFFKAKKAKVCPVIRIERVNDER